MIGVALQGRLGNTLFQLSLAEKLAEKLKTSVCIVDREPPRPYYTDELYNVEFFKRWDVVTQDKLKNYTLVTKNEQVKTAKNNTILKGYFLGKQYAYPGIRSIFTPSKELKEELMDLYGPTKDSLSIHIRRGDFLNPDVIKGGWYSCPKEYWEAAFKVMNKKYDKVIIISDDIEWCKSTLEFDANVIYADKKMVNSALFGDLFLPSLCGDNIISASTFSWWGMYLNDNPNKKVIMPYPWNTIPGNGRNTLYYMDDCIKLGIYDYKIK